MQLLPVLDVKRGLVVRAVGGRRRDYRPIVSKLCRSADPVEIARAFRDRYQLTELYLADLDAIAGRPPALPVYADIQALGCSLWVDAGLRTAVAAQCLAMAGVAKIIAGLETLEGPAELAALCSRFGADRIVFSLDLKDGVPIGDKSSWGESPFGIATRVSAVGIRHLIVLDLARVGQGAGTGTEDLCGRLARDYPNVEIIAGGGVRGLGDLCRLARAGVSGALVASALHDGVLLPEDVALLRFKEGCRE